MVYCTCLDNRFNSCVFVQESFTEDRRMHLIPLTFNWRVEPKVQGCTL